MTETVTVARPYAEAAFKLASEGGAQEAWSGALARLAVVAEAPAIREQLGDPKLETAQAVQLFADLAGGLSPEQKNFLTVLAENERLALLPEIHALFSVQKNAAEGLREAVIHSAFPMDAATLAQLVTDLEARFKVKIKARVELAPELIGGVRIAIGDEVIDASVRGKLAALATALKN